MIHILTNNYKIHQSDEIEIVNAVSLYNRVRVTGYSQGDVVDVIYKMEKSGYLSEDNGDKASKVFEDYIYRAPLYCDLTVDDEEYSLHEEMKNLYEYDATELVEIAKKKGLSEKVLEWLTENLPTEPNHS